MIHQPPASPGILNDRCVVAFTTRYFTDNLSLAHECLFQRYKLCKKTRPRTAHSCAQPLLKKPVVYGPHTRILRKNDWLKIIAPKKTVLKKTAIGRIVFLPISKDRYFDRR